MQVSSGRATVRFKIWVRDSGTVERNVRKSLSRMLKGAMDHDQAGTKRHGL